MTGMKEGAGENPFEESAAADPTKDPNQESIDDTATNDQTEAARSQQDVQSVRIPYKFRRDGVQDGRDRVPLFLHPETKRAEREAVRELENRFDEDVSLTDLREAVVKVGLRHIDEVEAHLEEWGYGVTFD